MDFFRKNHTMVPVPGTKKNKNCVMLSPLQQDASVAKPTTKKLRFLRHLIKCFL
jgi:hypothetical protein